MLVSFEFQSQFGTEENYMRIPKVYPTLLLVLGGSVMNAAHHVFMLALRSYYGSDPSVRICPDEESAAYYMIQNPGFVVYIFDGTNAAEITKCFEALAFTNPGIVKILAMDELQALSCEEDFGQESIIYFSDQYQGENLTIQLRQTIGPSSQDMVHSSKVDRTVWKPTDEFLGVIVENTDRLAHRYLRYPDITRCLYDHEFAAINNHFGGGDQLSQSRLASYCPHLEVCDSCAKEFENQSNVRAAGIQMLTSELIVQDGYASGSPDLHVSAVPNQRIKD
ncbi:MAG TPA: hypothetical protein VHQ41_02370 [Patescibacteria group bacterium]|jgi:hypothetical protein|nr:hypothetical protein [Patescibacteria group bacterium]